METAVTVLSALLGVCACGLLIMTRLFMLWKDEAASCRVELERAQNQCVELQHLSDKMGTEQMRRCSDAKKLKTQVEDLREKLKSIADFATGQADWIDTGRMESRLCEAKQIIDEQIVACQET